MNQRLWLIKYESFHGNRVDYGIRGIYNNENEATEAKKALMNGTDPMSALYKIQEVDPAADSKIWLFSYYY